MYLQVQSATLSIEVSYPFHSYLIGRSGQNINRVMEETETRIHCPERNRIAGESKSNSVIIRGPLANLENARQRIRVSLTFPLISLSIFHSVLMSLCDWCRQISRSSLSSIAALKGLIQSASYIWPTIFQLHFAFCYVSTQRLTVSTARWTFVDNRTDFNSSRRLFCISDVLQILLW